MRIENGISSYHRQQLRKIVVRPYRLTLNPNSEARYTRHLDVTIALVVTSCNVMFLNEKRGDGIFG